jgi:hypothetical protein
MCDPQLAWLNYNSLTISELITIVMRKQNNLKTN